MRSTRHILLAFGVVGVVFLTACADPMRPGSDGSTGSGSGGPTSPSSPGTDEEHDLDAPPPVTVRSADRSIDLTAWTYCFGNLCVDGAPPADPPDVGSPEEIAVEFPLSGWSFTASFVPAGTECGGRVQPAPLTEIGDGHFILPPIGHADTYDVTLFGRGNGDLFVTFRWTTPIDGPLPEPEARLAVLAGHDGQIDSYGVELEVSNLAHTPEEAEATITVRAETGEEITFDATRARSRCWPEGTVYWDGPDQPGLHAAALGGGPFTYEVELVLDGVRYAAIASWPADEIVGNEPSVALGFTPDLPAVS
jgi:hypothetical protein